MLVKPQAPGTPSLLAGDSGGRMFQHILVPTDGSELADMAVNAAIKFASEAGARITAFTVVPAYRQPSEVELMSRQGSSKASHEQRSRAQARDTLDKVAQRARAAGVPYADAYAESDSPYQAIIDAAQARGCDLIFISSHGRRGISALLHGSQTQSLLTHSTIPTLVYR
jgi:nucleotide-binding universal stress UspA family protein